MGDMDRIRLARLERTSQELAERLTRLEARGAVLEAAPERPTAVSSPVATPLRAPATETINDDPQETPPSGVAFRRPIALSREPGHSFEDLLGGRVLAWAGAVAVLVGIVLLFAIAISRGWIGEEARTLMGALISSSLVAAGFRLHARRGRTDAAIAAAAAGLGGLFVTVTVATRIYELIPTGLGVALGLATGVLSTSLALRWRDVSIAALGIVGGLLAPVLVDAPPDGPTTALLFTAALSAAAVCVRERWDWLGLAAAAAVTPQWADYLMNDPSAPSTLATLVAFGAVAAAGAVGFEVRERTAAVRPVSVLLLALNGFVLAAVGWLALDGSDLWLMGLAGAHMAIGTGLLRNSRASRPVGVLAASLGVVLGDLALVQLLDGPALTLSWAVVAVGFAVLVRFTAARGGALADAAAGAGLAGHVALGLLHGVMADLPPEAILGGRGAGMAASGSLAGLAAACLAAGLALAHRPRWRDLLNGLGLATTAYLMAANLDGTLLVGAWAMEAVALAEIARRTCDRFAFDAAVAHLALASVHTVAFEAPPSALLVGLAHPLAATVAVAACVVAAWRCALAASRMLGAEAPSSERDTSRTSERAQPAPNVAVATAAAGALLVLHLASAQLVTAAGAGARAQTLLSVMWGVVGVAALVGGLLRDSAPLRTGALWLLLAALAKVFLYDLSALTSVARVVSFIALGLLLLLAAFVWQRMRPRPLPDLRDAAPSVRG